MSNIRSHDLDDSPAIFNKRGLARQQRSAYRIIAVGFFLATLAGSLLFGGGGVDLWIALTPIWAGAAAALILQAICTYTQYVFCANWKSPPYLIAVGLSSAMSMGGFLELIHAPIAGWLRAAWGIDGLAATIGIGLILWIACIMIDVIPERILAT